MLLKREGLWPAVIGTAVATTGAALLRRHSAVGSGILGFGLAHILLGAIDLVRRR